MLEKIVQSLDITSLLIVAIFFLFLEYRPPWWYRSQNECNKGVRLIPGPFSLPVFGTSWIFYSGRYTFNRLHEFYEDMHKKYGAIMKEECWCNVPVVNLFEKRDIVKVLKSGGKYPLRPPVEAIAHYRRSRPDRYASIGLVNEQGESWHFLRTTLTPVLTSPKTISSFLPEVKEIADDWCNLLKQLRDVDDKISNLEYMADRLGLEITCALVLGRRMGFLLPGGETEIAKNFAEAVRQHFLATRDTYFGLPFWKLFATPAYKRLIKNEETIYELALELIQSANESTKESAVFQSVLKADIDEKEKIAAIIDFISAGIHTMKNSFLFLLHLVGQDRQIQRNIIDDSKKVYVKACLTESFRLYPTANALGRILDEEMELSGYRLQPGTVVVCHSGIACKDERNFKEPHKFRPERWLDDEKVQTTSNSTFLFAPFGAGRRICPGKRFIEQILPTILDHTVNHFEIVIENPLQLQFEFLLAPKGSISMIFKDRISE
ncbi:cytochrome P450 CYP314A1 [Asbolus verrucosus]|uniref:Cytochrome P450 CYP314A1 n=1 Tax=Asbolus verrucosus TaxID=1661398 RepID=A0A482VHR2_ASBVE|nr:cytochrome P450 CYP314A1 [Asbolus verrucosus]